MRRLVTLILLGTLVAGTQAATAAPVEPEVYLKGPGSQFLPAVNDEWFAWTESQRSQRRAHVRPIGSTGSGRVLPAKLPNGFTFSGGFDPDGLYIYQRGSYAGPGRSELRVLDPVTGTTQAPPSGVNTDRWEWLPSWSADHILFGRNSFARPSSPWRVILYDRATQRQKVLDRATFKCACIFPGNVTERYATWTKCTRREGCEVYVYDLMWKVTNQVRGQPHQYSGRVTSDGVLYFLRSGDRCGQNVRLVRWVIGPATPTLVVRIPRSFDVFGELAMHVKEDGHTDVYFDLGDCRKERVKTDLYVVGDADTVSPEVAMIAEGGGGSRGAQPLRSVKARMNAASASMPSSDMAL